MTLDSITASKWELSNRLTTFCSLPLLATPCESVIDSCSATSPLCDRFLAFHDLWHCGMLQGFCMFHQHSGHWKTRKQNLQIIAAPCTKHMRNETQRVAPVKSPLNKFRCHQFLSALWTLLRLLRPIQFCSCSHPSSCLAQWCLLLCRNFSRTSEFSIEKEGKHTTNTCKTGLGKLQESTTYSFHAFRLPLHSTSLLAPPYLSHLLVCTLPTQVKPTAAAVAKGNLRSFVAIPTISISVFTLASFKGMDQQNHNIVETSLKFETTKSPISSTLQESQRTPPE